MRTRKEIEESSFRDYALAMPAAQLEVLLDIRELLALPPAVGYPGMTGKVFDPGEEKVGEVKHNRRNHLQDGH